MNLEAKMVGMLSREEAVRLIESLLGKGLNMTEIAAGIGVSPAALYLWRQGKTKQPTRLASRSLLRFVGQVAPELLAGKTLPAGILVA